MLLETNYFKQIFFHTFEVLNMTPSRDLEIRILADPSKDLHRYNAPSVNEIAIIIPTNQSHSFNPCDIVLHWHGGDLEFIHDHHQAYAPLHYVLLFPYGTPGWMLRFHSDRSVFVSIGIEVFRCAVRRYCRST